MGIALHSHMIAGVILTRFGRRPVAFTFTAIAKPLGAIFLGAILLPWQNAAHGTAESEIYLNLFEDYGFFVILLFVF